MDFLVSIESLLSRWSRCRRSGGPAWNFNRDPGESPGSARPERAATESLIVIGTCPHRIPAQPVDDKSRCAPGCFNQWGIHERNEPAARGVLPPVCRAERQDIQDAQCKRPGRPRQDPAIRPPIDDSRNLPDDERRNPQPCYDKHCVQCELHRLFSSGGTWRVAGSRGAPRGHIRPAQTDSSRSG